MADSVTKPRARRPVGPAVHRDDAPIAVLFVKNRHEPRALHDAVMAAVGSLPHHCRHAVGQASFAGIGIEERVVGAGPVVGDCADFRFLCVRRIGKFPVARLDDERRLFVDLPRPSVILPEAVVFVPADGRLGYRAASDVHTIDSRELLGFLIFLGLLPLGDFFVGERLTPGQLRGPFERNGRFVFPHPLQVRVAPRRPRRLRGFGRRWRLASRGRALGGDRLGRQCGHQSHGRQGTDRGKVSLVHASLPAFTIHN
jgi:hypothetical protein